MESLEGQAVLRTMVWNKMAVAIEDERPVARVVGVCLALYLSPPPRIVRLKNKLEVLQISQGTPTLCALSFVMHASIEQRFHHAQQQ